MNQAAPHNTQPDSPLWAAIAEARVAHRRLEALLASAEGRRHCADATALPAYYLVKIRADVAKFFGLSVRGLLRRTHEPAVAWPRQVCMFLMRELTDASTSQIGEVLGRRDHGTVIYGSRMVKNRCEVMESSRAAVDRLRALLVEKYGLSPN